MKTTIYFLFFLFSLLCNEAKANDNDTMVVIEGTVKGIPATKVYLTDAYYWQKNLDSADYKNDTFTFCLPAKNFKPFCASIYFSDSTFKGRRNSLVFHNPLFIVVYKNEMFRVRRRLCLRRR